MNDNRALAVVPSAEEVQAAMGVAKSMFESGYWADVKSVAQAFVKIQAGREWGIPPFSAMSAVHIIQGKPTMAAGAMAAKIKSSGKYDYRVKELTAQACTVEFYEQGRLVGAERFTVEDAKAAELSSPMWKKYPKNMCFARTISNGARFYCADIFNGSVYTPEEMGVQMNPEMGEIVSIPAEAVRVLPAAPAQAQPEPAASPMEKLFSPEPQPSAALPAQSLGFTRLRSDTPAPRSQTQPLAGTVDCEHCKKPITGHKDGDAFYRADLIVQKTRERTEMALCWNCYLAAQARPAPEPPADVLEGEVVEAETEF